MVPPLSTTGHKRRSAGAMWRCCNSTLTFFGDRVCAGWKRSPARQLRTTSSFAGKLASGCELYSAAADGAGNRVARITLPISATPMSLSAPLEMVHWGSRVFSAGLQIAMPIVAAMLITNIALAILTRAAPQLNLFGIGFPITLGAGFLIISLTLPYLGTPLQNLFNQGIEAGRKIPRVGGQRPGQPPPPAAPR